MSLPIPRSGTRRFGRAPALIALTFAATFAGCSLWNLGPEPSTFVGPSSQGAEPQTDRNLQAVLPVVPGDKPGGGADLPGATMPATMPVSTQPAATQPEVIPLASGTTPPAPPEALSVQAAVLVGLENNSNLRVQKFNVPIKRAGEEQALSAFDPTVNYSLANDVGSSAQNGYRTTDSVAGSASITEFLPTGTTIKGSVGTGPGGDFFYNESGANLDNQLKVTQSLLRGAGLDVNLASLRKAEIATRFTQYQLRATAEMLVHDIEVAYWKLAYTERAVAIVENALKVAQAQLDQINAEIRNGRLSPTESAAAIAQVATEKEDLINAKSDYEEARLALMQLITPTQRQFWGRNVTLTTLPFIPIGELDPVDSHIAVAMKFLPEINETRLDIQSAKLDVIVSKNGLLPRLDFFVQLDKSSAANNFGNSFSAINGRAYDVQAGLQGDWEPLNRSAEAAYHTTVLTRDQDEEALRNLMQKDELSIRQAYIEVQRTLAQIPATRAAREAQEVSFTTEQQKLLNGRSTTILVAAAQQNLLVAQLNELQAVTGHLTALVTLYTNEGSLLLRRGIEAPGAAPPPDPAYRK